LLKLVSSSQFLVHTKVYFISAASTSEAKDDETAASTQLNEAQTVDENFNPTFEDSGIQGRGEYLPLLSMKLFFISNN
jgi:phage-related minor tail protein